MKDAFAIMLSNPVFWFVSVPVIVGFFVFIIQFICRNDD